MLVLAVAAVAAGASHTPADDAAYPAASVCHVLSGSCARFTVLTSGLVRIRIKRAPLHRSRSLPFGGGGVRRPADVRGGEPFCPSIGVLAFELNRRASATVIPRCSGWCITTEA